MNALIQNPETAFSAEERAEMLADCLPALARRDRVVEMVEAGDAGTQAALRPELDRLNEQIRSTWSDYQARLPILQLSRCPFTGDACSHSLDPYGVDGFWWNYYKPIRLLKEPLGGRFLAFKGAMRPPEEALMTPFMVSPGPDVPYVIQRLMQFPSVTAVLSHVQVGTLDAYPIVYFSSAEIRNDQRSNDWGTDSYSFRGPRDDFEQAEYFDAEDEFQYGIERWIEQKRLQWIEPGDAKLTLRRDVMGCPYLKLDGKKAVWRSKSGRLWWGPVGKE